MNEKELSDQLDRFLEQLIEGIPIDQILTEHSSHTTELGQLVEAADQLLRSSSNIPDFTEAQSRSRATFLSESAKQKTARRKRFRLGLPVRLTGSIVLVTGFLLAITGLASANSLPGEQLYPLKLAIEQAQIGLTADPGARLQLEQTFEQQRSGEVSALIQQGRNQQVTFYGFVAVPKKGPVEVGGLPVTLPPEQEKNISQLAGSYVAVTGKTGSKGVEAIGKIHLQTVQLDGTIQGIEGNHWKIDNLVVAVNSATEIQGKPKKGQHVYINATRLVDGKLMAMSINLDQPDAKKEANELLVAPNETQESDATRAPVSSKPTLTATPSPTKKVPATASKTDVPRATRTEQDKSTATPENSPTAVRTVHAKLTGTPEPTPTPTRTVSPTRTEQAAATPTASPTSTATPDPFPVKKSLPTLTPTHVKTMTPSPTIKPDATLPKSLTSQINDEGVQEEKRERAGSPDGEPITPTPTPTPIESGKDKRNNSLAPTPAQNARPLIQLSDPNERDEPDVQSSPDPAYNCLMTPQAPDSPVTPTWPPNSQTNSPDCTPVN